MLSFGPPSEEEILSIAEQAGIDAEIVLRWAVEDGTQKYWLWINEDYAGPFSTRQIARLAADSRQTLDEDEEAPNFVVSRNTLYWSNVFQEWKKLAGIAADWTPPNRRAQAKAVGVKFLSYLGSHTDSDCPVCLALDGNVVPIEPEPPFPPEGCTCDPWCRGMWISHFE